MNFGFIIPSFCKTDQHLDVLKYCIKSIRKFYPNNKIIIINDFSLIDISKPFTNDLNVNIVMSTQKGAADISTYEYFYNNKLFDIAVIMQDSMFFENKVETLDQIEKVLPLWHATNHRREWDTTIVPKTQIADMFKNEITTHSEHIITHIKKILGDTEFTKYALNLYKQKERWSVTFGPSVIISHNFLTELQEKTNILSLFTQLYTNWQRRIAESVFSLGIHYLLGDKTNENSLNGLYYDGIRHPSNICHNHQVQIPELDKFSYCAKGKYTSKISFNRR